MNKYKEQSEYFICFLLLLIALIPIPHNIQNVFYSTNGKIVLFATSIASLFYSPMVGSIAIVVAFLLSNEFTKVWYNARQFISTEKQRASKIQALNPDIKPTLEEEIINKMSPMFSQDHKTTFIPNDTDILNETHL